MTWNVGSVIEEVGKRVSNIPTSLSGTNMTGIVEEAIQTIYTYTGENPGTTGIDIKYNKTIFCLTAADITQAKQDDTDINGTDNGYKIGDFTFRGDNTNSGDGSVLALQYDKYIKCAEKQLKLLGFKIQFGKSNG